MKRLFAILILLSLILTGCAGIKEAAKGEESTGEVIAQQETKGPTQAETSEPAVGSTENSAEEAAVEAAEEPTQESTEESIAAGTGPDGWDAGIGAKSWHDRTPLNEEELPEVCRGKVIDWIYTDFALIIISSDNYVGYIVDGELTKAWDIKVKPDNFLFDASLFNANAKYRWYGYVGDSIVRIKSDVVEYETRSIAQYAFNGSDWYCYYILSNNLYFWSPSCTTLVDTAVVETYTKDGYTFYRKVTDDVFVIDANPFTVGRQTQEYVNAHPLTPVYLGNGPMHNYYVQLNPENGESKERLGEEFEQRYGLNTAIYGNPTDEIDVADFIRYATESRNHIFDRYGIPTENTKEMFKFDNIYLHGHLGHLRVFYKNDAIDYLSWTCYEHSWDIYDDLHEYFLSYGPIGESRMPRDGQIEESAVVDGYTIFAGYEDSDHGQYTYAFILYQ